MLLLTVLSEVEDRVKGLELGADDYLVKLLPFSNCWPGSIPSYDVDRSAPRRCSG